MKTMNAPSVLSSTFDTPATPAYRTLVVALGSSGDVHPMLALAIELHRRGRAVTVYANGSFEPLVRRFGLDFAAMGTAEEYQQTTRDPELWHPTRGFKAVFRRGVAPSLRPTYDLIAHHASLGPTVVVATPIAFGARVAQEKLGVPMASVNFAPLAYLSIDAPPRTPLGPPRWLPRWLRRRLFAIAERTVVDPVICPQLNAFRAELGLPPVRRVFGKWWQSPQLSISLFPDWFAPPAPDWPANHVQCGFPLFDERDPNQPLPEAIERFLSAGSPPIVFTPGSAMRFGHVFFKTALQACQNLGRRAMLLTRHPEQLPAEMPDFAAHFDYVPLSQVLPRCAALVSHGGIGTVAQGLAASVPQVVMAMSHDQFDNAARLERLDVGQMLPRPKFTPARLTSVLKCLLDDPEMPARCEAIRRRFDPQRDIECAVDAIDALAAAELGQPPAARVSSPVAAGH
jgi:rhamnosyltransferase subunit B